MLILKKIKFCNLKKVYVFVGRHVCMYACVWYISSSISYISSNIYIIYIIYLLMTYMLKNNIYVSLKIT